MNKKKMIQPKLEKGSNYAACVICPGSQVSIGFYAVLLPVCSALAIAG